MDWTLDLSPQQHHSKAVLQEKLKGVQCFESVKPRVFSNIRISIKRLRFPYSPRVKVSCQGQRGTAIEWPCIHPLPLERANSDMFTSQPWGLSRGLCCHFLSHFWHHLSLSIEHKLLSIQSGICRRYRAWRELLTFLSRGTVLKQ